MAATTADKPDMAIAIHAMRALFVVGAIVISWGLGTPPPIRDLLIRVFDIRELGRKRYRRFMNGPLEHINSRTK